MDNALHPDEMSADQRLREVAQLLAEGLLRRRLREARTRRKSGSLAENALAVSPRSRTHGSERSQTGERP
jgi:hypothetical protein